MVIILIVGVLAVVLATNPWGEGADGRSLPKGQDGGVEGVQDSTKGGITITPRDGKPVVVPFEGDRKLQEAISNLSKVGGGTIVFPPGIYPFDRGMDLRNVRNVHLVGKPGCIFKMRTMAEWGQIRLTRSSRIGDGVLHVDHPELVRKGTRYQVIPADLKGNRVLELVAGDIVDGSVKISSFTVKTRDEYVEGMFLVPQINFLDGYQCGDMSFTNIVFDGNFDTTKPLLGGRKFVGHTLHCGLLFRNPYHDKPDKPAPRPATRNIRVVGCEFTNLLGRGVAIYNVDGITIRDCRFSNMAAEGLEVDHLSAHANISSCKFRDLWIGMRLNDCTDVSVRGCELEGCSFGIHLTRALKDPTVNQRIVVNDNIIRGGFQGIIVDPGFRDVTLENNVLSGVKIIGIRIGGDRVVCTGNSISSPRRCGIQVRGLECVIKDNKITPLKPTPAGFLPIDRQ